MAVALFAAYYPALDCGYIWDDPQYLVENPTLRSLDGLEKIWAFSLFKDGAFHPWCNTPQYYPLVFTSFWLEFQLFGGLNFKVYHFFNILLHLLSALIVWRLLRRLSVPGAWTAAAIFALHPVHVESVVWITERKNVLSLFFYLCAFYAYLRFALPGLFVKTEDSSGEGARQDRTDDAPRDGAQPDLRFYILAFACFVCALLSKTVTSTFPAAVLLILWWKKERITLRDIYMLVPFFAAGIAFGLMTAGMETTHVGAQGDEWSLNWAERFLLAGRIPWFYALKLVFPLNLIFIYPRWEIDLALWWQYLFPVAWVCVVLGLWFLRARIGKAPLVAVLFFLGSLFPALGFFNVFPMRFSFVADHFQYLASLGLIALGTAAVCLLLGLIVSTKSRVPVIAALVVLVALGGLSWRRIPAYHDRVALWQDTLERNPHAWIAHNNLGEIFFSLGRVDEAMQYSMNALELKPDLPEAHGNLANAYYGKGKYDLAVEHYHELLRLDPDNVIARNNLAYTLEKQGRIDEAIVRCREAIQIAPMHPKSHYILANLLVSSHSYTEAIQHYKAVLSVEPNHLDANYRLGVVLQAEGKNKEAEPYLQKALHLSRISGNTQLVQELEARLQGRIQIR